MQKDILFRGCMCFHQENERKNIVAASLPSGREKEGSQQTEFLIN